MVELVCCLVIPLALLAGWCIEAGVDVYFWTEDKIEERIRAWRQKPEQPFPYGWVGIRAIDCLVMFGLLFASMFGLTVLFYFAISIGVIVTPLVVVGVFLFLWLFFRVVGAPSVETFEKDPERPWRIPIFKVISSACILSAITCGVAML